MTDITTEQIAWADDELSRKGWGLAVERAVSASKMGWPAHTTPTTSHCSDILYAHARHLRLEAENARLRETPPEIELTKRAMAIYVGHADMSWGEAWEQALQGSDE